MIHLSLYYNIDIIYHSAAYKHVPLVEKNPISGIFNNINNNSSKKGT